MNVQLSDIRIGQRHRKDLGDIPALAASIERVGLLHPVVIRPDKSLVVGERRIAAYRHLGRKTIAANVAKNLTELGLLLEAECDENTCRKDFLPSEGHALYMALLPVEEEKAAAAQSAGQKSGGGDRRSDAAKRSGGTSPKAKRDETKRAKETAAKASRVSRKTAEQRRAVMESGDVTLIAEMDRTGKVAGVYRKLKTRQEHARQQAAAALVPPDDRWFLTDDQTIVSCEALLTDPPYGILDESWEPKELETFTRQWAKRWAKCGADFMAVFWSQRYLWEGRKWFDESFTGYHFQQLLVWHYANNKSPQSRLGFKQTWEPIFFYRRADSDKEIRVGGGDWGKSLTDFDCHVAAVPQSNFTGTENKRHPAQKPVSVMQWLVNALTRPGELVVDPFCGVGTTGIASLQLGRRFHGIETDETFRKIAGERITTYGTASV